MSGKEVEVRELLGALSSKISESKEMLDGQEIGNALYGLQGMSSEEVEVREVLRALSSKIIVSAFSIGLLSDILFDNAPSTSRTSFSFFSFPEDHTVHNR